MAFVTRDKRDGQWLARWRDPAGRERKKSFGRRVDAQRWLDQQQSAMHRGQYLDPRAGTVRLAEIAAAWAAGLTHLKVSTATRYRSILAVHVQPAFGTWQINQIRPSDVQAWVTFLHGTKLAPGSVRQCHRVLSLVLDTAVADSRLPTNPARGVKLPRARRAEPRFLTAAEVGRLVDESGDAGLQVAVLALCGLRFGELAALRVRHLDLSRGRLAVQGSVTEVGGHLVWSDPKSHRGRSVPFPGSLTSPLRQQTLGKRPGDPLFTSPDGGVLRLNNWRRRVFDPARTAIGREDITPHDLRHTAASLAIKAGANVKAVQRMLGHASAAMTLDVYAGLFNDDLDGVATALDTLMQGSLLPSSLSPSATASPQPQRLAAVPRLSVGRPPEPGATHPADVPGLPHPAP